VARTLEPTKSQPGLLTRSRRQRTRPEKEHTTSWACDPLRSATEGDRKREDHETAANEHQRDRRYQQTNDLSGSRLPTN
jgi:hypothetical protein